MPRADTDTEGPTLVTDLQALASVPPFAHLPPSTGGNGRGNHRRLETIVDPSDIEMSGAAKHSSTAPDCDICIPPSSNEPQLAATSTCTEAFRGIKRRLCSRKKDVLQLNEDPTPGCVGILPGLSSSIVVVIIFAELLAMPFFASMLIFLGGLFWPSAIPAAFFTLDITLNYAHLFFTRNIKVVSPVCKILYMIALKLKIGLYLGIASVLQTVVMDLTIRQPRTSFTPIAFHLRSYNAVFIVATVLFGCLIALTFAQWLLNFLPKIVGIVIKCTLCYLRLKAPPPTIQLDEDGKPLNRATMLKQSPKAVLFVKVLARIGWITGAAFMALSLVDVLALYSTPRPNVRPTNATGFATDAAPCQGLIPGECLLPVPSAYYQATVGDSSLLYVPSSAFPARRTGPWPYGIFKADGWPVSSPIVFSLGSTVVVDDQSLSDGPIGTEAGSIPVNSTQPVPIAPGDNAYAVASSVVDSLKESTTLLLALLPDGIEIVPHMSQRGNFESPELILLTPLVPLRSGTVYVVLVSNMTVGGTIVPPLRPFVDIYGNVTDMAVPTDLRQRAYFDTVLKAVRAISASHGSVAARWKVPSLQLGFHFKTMRSPFLAGDSPAGNAHRALNSAQENLSKMYCSKIDLKVTNQETRRDKSCSVITWVTMVLPFDAGIGARASSINLMIKSPCSGIIDGFAIYGHSLFVNRAEGLSPNVAAYVGSTSRVRDDACAALNEQKPCNATGVAARRLAIVAFDLEGFTNFDLLHFARILLVDVSLIKDVGKQLSTTVIRGVLLKGLFAKCGVELAYRLNLPGNVKSTSGTVPVSYLGNSYGAIMGAAMTLLAHADPFGPSVLNVGGACWAQLLPRYDNYQLLRTLLKFQMYSDSDILVMISISQLYFDGADAAPWLSEYFYRSSSHVGEAYPLKNIDYSPSDGKSSMPGNLSREAFAVFNSAPRLLLHQAVVDRTVSTTVNLFLARSLGSKLLPDFIRPVFGVGVSNDHKAVVVLSEFSFYGASPPLGHFCAQWQEALVAQTYAFVVMNQTAPVCWTLIDDVCQSPICSCQCYPKGFDPI